MTGGEGMNPADPRIKSENKPDSCGDALADGRYMLLDALNEPSKE
jgi:hypothetical protein